MTVPLQITFKDMDPSPALEARIRKHAERLEHFEGDILRCHITVEAPHRHHHQGKLYRTRVEIFVPRATIVVNEENPQNHAHEDAYVAARDAFDAAVRRLEDHVRKLSGKTKVPADEPVLGEVVRFVAEGGYGFIETRDGREIYFDRNSLGAVFDELRVGESVQVSVAEGEKGPQARAVRRVGRSRQPG